ncbi:hypothetical protein [Rhizobium grahamii]|uniref:Uncharacterized protein n=1 Tax=Rhizobium grahamii TaxID=1120045 RepID=A0A370KHW5_9HYPH|nr:hypothetical protein [Rhizobium grahamii]RDJ05261.1 hypothetical protein B5K06_25925 [Rhizobium grahamii]
MRHSGVVGGSSPVDRSIILKVGGGGSRSRTVTGHGVCRDFRWHLSRRCRSDSALHRRATDAALNTLIFAKLLSQDVVAELDDTFDIEGLKLVALPERTG